MSSVFGNTYLCEQIFSLIKKVISRTKLRLTDEHVEERTQMATGKIKPDIERLLKQKQF
jgi:hypothetical protein